MLVADMLFLIFGAAAKAVLFGANLYVGLGSRCVNDGNVSSDLLANPVSSMTRKSPFVPPEHVNKAVWLFVTIVYDVILFRFHNVFGFLLFVTWAPLPRSTGCIGSQKLSWRRREFERNGFISTGRMFL